MKIGDLVKGIRYHDKIGMGIILHIDHRLIHAIADYPRSRIFVTVQWADRISTVYEKEIEVVNESR